MNISGVVIRTTKKQVNEVARKLKESGLCDVHASEESTGKIIITIEGQSVKTETEKLKQIQLIKGVFSADMAYAYSDQDFSAKNITGSENSSLDLNNRNPIK